MMDWGGSECLVVRGVWVGVCVVGRVGRCVVSGGEAGVVAAARGAVREEGAVGGRGAAAVGAGGAWWRGTLGVGVWCMGGVKGGCGKRVEKKSLPPPPPAQMSASRRHVRKTKLKDQR